MTHLTHKHRILRTALGLGGTAALTSPLATARSARAASAVYVCPLVAPLPVYRYPGRLTLAPTPAYPYTLFAVPNADRSVGTA
jgi:hypothetical protein